MKNMRTLLDAGLVGLLVLLSVNCGGSKSAKLEEAARNGRLDVTMFGARGDGVKDDTQAIQDARSQGRRLAAGRKLQFQ